MDSEKKAPVSARVYSKDYFTKMCDGFQTFDSGALIPRMKQAIEMAELKEGNVILDLGCGRGELISYLNQNGMRAFGTDFAPPALELARQLEGAREKVLRADCKKIPFKSNTFDCVFFLETYEHLHPWEIAQTVAEVQRVLKKGGTFIVSTSPNAWLAKPLYGAGKLLGLKRGINEHVHVNEQSYFSLKKDLEQNGFSCRVILEYQGEWFEAALSGKKIAIAQKIVSAMKSKPAKWLASQTPAKFFLSTHLWAIATKK